MIKFQKVNNTFQAKNWLISGWKLFKKQPLTWVFMVLIFNIFMIVGSTFSIGRFIVALLLPVLAGGIFIALDKASRDEPIGLENLFSVFKDKPILKELLMVGAIGVGIVALTMLLQTLTGTDYTVMLDTTKGEGVNVEDSVEVFEKVSEGGLFTTLIPWVWSWALLFGIPLVAVNREAAIPALKHSLLACMFNFVPFVVFFVMIVLLTIISILPVGLGLLVFIPILFGATYFAFREIYVEAETEYVSELGVGLNAIAEAIEEQEEQSVVYTNNKEHQVSDLKDAYRSIWLTTLLGMALVTIGIILAGHSFYSLQVGTNTMGEVLSVETHQSSRSGGGTSTTYRPTFLFTDKHGEQHTAPTSSMSSELNYPIGAHVKISYNPSDYSTVQINSIKSILYLPILLWLFGVPIFWLSIKAKKDVDENGVPPRKSVFLKEGYNTPDVLAEFKNSEKVSISEVLKFADKIKQDKTNEDSINEENTDQNKKTDELVELVLPQKFTLDVFEEYMHITLSWFGKRTIASTLFAVIQIGFCLIILNNVSGGFLSNNSSLMDNLLPWVFGISGLGFLYYALATWINKTHIYVSKNAIEIKQKPLPWFGNKRLVTTDIKQLYSKKQISSSTSNNRSTISYHLHVVSIDEDDMRLLKVENAEQALFLEQEIEKYLGIKDLRVRGEIG